MNNTELLKEETKKEKDSSKIRQIAFENVKKYKNGFSLHLFFFAFFSILSLILLLVLPTSYIVTVPLVVIPSLFGFTSCNCLRKDKDVKNLKFFLMFKNYFKRYFFGAYRLIIGFIKFLAVYILSGGVLSITFTFIFLNNNETFKSIIDKYSGTTNYEGLIEELDGFVSSNTLLHNLSLLSIFIATLLAIIVLINHIAKHSLKLRFNLLNKQVLDMKLIVAIDKIVRQKNKKYILKSYLKSTWFINLLVLLAGCGGLVLTYFFFSNIESVAVISLFLMLLVLLPFMNYLSEVQDALFLSLKDSYEESFIELTMMYIEKYKNQMEMSEDEKNKLQHVLDLHKKGQEPDDQEDKK